MLVSAIGFQPHSSTPTATSLRACFRVDFATFQPHTAHNSNSEQYMMWRKAELFGDAEMAAAILQERNPGKVKALGRRVRNFDKDKWDAVARQCVRDGVVLKFRQNAALRDVLLATGEKMMVEASPTDAIWGIGLSEERALSTPPAQWPGTNWLGLVLNEARTILRAESAQSVADNKKR